MGTPICPQKRIRVTSFKDGLYMFRCKSEELLMQLLVEMVKKLSSSTIWKGQKY